MGIMLVYDITNAKSFENIAKWLRNIDEVRDLEDFLRNYKCNVISYLPQHANEDVEKMILGNKCDMDENRQVPKERGDAVRE